jgi:hypothetical protein
LHWQSDALTAVLYDTKYKGEVEIHDKFAFEVADNHDNIWNVIETDGNFISKNCFQRNLLVLVILTTSVNGLPKRTYHS